MNIVLRKYHYRQDLQDLQDLLKVKFINMLILSNKLHKSLLFRTVEPKMLRNKRVLAGKL